LTARKLERGGGYSAKFEHLDETKDLTADLEHLEKLFVVEAPAFMRGKERFSDPGKGLNFDHAL
jgi:hypothetical protein